MYMITQSKGMAERSFQRAKQVREELRQVVGYSIADEIEKLDRLKKLWPFDGESRPPAAAARDLIAGRPA
jgi:hypothetical protein